MSKINLSKYQQAMADISVINSIIDTMWFMDFYDSILIVLNEQVINNVYIKSTLIYS